MNNETPAVQFTERVYTQTTARTSLYCCVDMRDVNGINTALHAAAKEIADCIKFLNSRGLEFVGVQWSNEFHRQENPDACLGHFKVIGEKRTEDA